MSNFNTIASKMIEFAYKCDFLTTTRYNSILYFPSPEQNALFIRFSPATPVKWGIIEQVDSLNFKLLIQGEVTVENYRGIFLYWLENYWENEA